PRRSDKRTGLLAKNGDILKNSCHATQLRRSVRRGTPFLQADWTKAAAPQPGLEDTLPPPGRPCKKSTMEKGHLFLTNTVLLTTSLPTALWLRPDIYLGMSPFLPFVNRIPLRSVRGG